MPFQPSAASHATHVTDASDCDALIIGGGFFGVEIALELHRLGLQRIVLVEREPGIMRRASFVNQARVHNGYHYPRSLQTAERSRANFEAFVADYADAVPRAMTKVYAIAAGSRVSPAQFEAFCRAVGLPCHPAPHRMSALFDRTLVQQAYLTRELAFDSAIIAARLARAMEAARIEVLLGTSAQVLDAAPGNVTVHTAGATNHRFRARHVVNCTYADIEAAGVPLRCRVRRELTEMVLIAPPPELHGMGVTLMDGPFFSTMPFPAMGLHTLSHVRYTPHAATETPGPAPAPRRSNSAAILRDSQRYLPCLARAEIRGSLFETKATLLRNEDDDSRPVLIERSREAPRILSVLGAKIDNIYDVRAFLRTQDWHDTGRMAA